MYGHGRHAQGPHRSPPTSPLEDKDHEQDLPQLAAPMDASPLRTRTRASSAIASLSTQPVNGSVPPSDSHETVLEVAGEGDWSEVGTIEDYVPDVPPLPLSQLAINTPSPPGSNIEGESLGPALARMTELPSPTGSIIEGMSVRATNAHSESPLLRSTRVPSTCPRTVLSSLAPPLPRVPILGTARVADLSLTTPISRLSLNPTRPAVRRYGLLILHIVWVLHPE
jgi:hypothetical protein